MSHTCAIFINCENRPQNWQKKNYGQNNIDVVSFVSDIWKFLNSRWEIWYQKYGNYSDVQFVFDMALFCVDFLKH